VGVLFNYLKKYLSLGFIVTQVTVHFNIIAGLRGMFLVVAAETAKAVFFIILVAKVL
jgi:hypothetical protein